MFRRFVQKRSFSQRWLLLSCCIFRNIYLKTIRKAAVRRPLWHAVPCSNISMNLAKISVNLGVSSPMPPSRKYYCFSFFPPKNNAYSRYHDVNPASKLKQPTLLVYKLQQTLQIDTMFNSKCPRKRTKGCPPAPCKHALATISQTTNTLGKKRVLGSSKSPNPSPCQPSSSGLPPSVPPEFCLFPRP